MLVQQLHSAVLQLQKPGSIRSLERTFKTVRINDYMVVLIIKNMCVELDCLWLRMWYHANAGVLLYCVNALLGSFGSN